MNRINPIYVVLLLIFIPLFLLFKLSYAKTELYEAREAYKQTLKLSTELDGLKKAYSKKLKLPSLKSASLVQKRSKSGLIISSKSIDIKELNFVMGKVLNGTYNINTLKIKKLSDTKVSLYMEIKW